MDWLWALIIVIVGNAALFAGVVLLTRLVQEWQRTKEG